MVDPVICKEWAVGGGGLVGRRGKELKFYQIPTNMMYSSICPNLLEAENDSYIKVI